MLVQEQTIDGTKGTRCARKTPAAVTGRQHLTNPARPAPQLAQLFSCGVAAAELRKDADASLLYPAEAAFCASFAAKRRADFTAGRLCARRALGELGIVDFSVAVNPDRSPCWPPGIAGSISHTEGYRCAVAADANHFGSIGIDVETVGRITPGVAALVFTAAEAAFLRSLAECGRASAATVIFSAKEAFYKCQYVLTGEWLDFHDVTVELTVPAMGGNAVLGAGDIANGSFRIKASVDRPGLGPRVVPERPGRFRVDGDLVATGITMP
jgi:4'-phosphopantetheinyl transferase EntD